MAGQATRHSVLAERLTALMDDRDMRPEDLASRLTVSHRTVTRWLAGENEPTPTMARRLGAYFDVDWREFYEAPA